MSLIVEGLKKHNLTRRKAWHPLLKRGYPRLAASNDRGVLGERDLVCVIVCFRGSNGWIWVNRAEIEASDEAMLSTPLPAGATRLYVSNDHMGNFFDCVRSRKMPVAEVEVGHRSASLCHLGVIALRLGRKLQWNPARETFTGDGAKEGNHWLARKMRRPFDYTFADA